MFASGLSKKKILVEYKLERTEQLKKALLFSSGAYIVPLFLLYLLADYFFYPEYLTEFFLVRVFVIVAVFLIGQITLKLDNYHHVQWLSTLAVQICSFAISLMLFVIDDSNSPYYVSLSLVIVGVSAGFPFSSIFYWLNMFLILAPTTIWVVFVSGVSGDSFFFLYLLFLLSITFLSFMSRVFIERLLLRDFLSRKKLQREIEKQGGELEVERSAREKLEAIKDLSFQVAHDIRSPLTALHTAVLAYESGSERAGSLMQTAVHRIQGIADDLIVKSKDFSRELKNRELAQVKPSSLEKKIPPLVSAITIPVFPVVQKMLEEKKMQYASRNNISWESSFDSGSVSSFVGLDEISISRVLSNLLDNSVEAIGNREDAVVIVQLHTDSKGYVTVCIQDTGMGMTLDQLSKVRSKGVTFKNGSGLGLTYACEVIEKHSGNVNIDSESGKGTTVTLKIPKMAQPSWFVEELTLDAQDTAIIVDDDLSIHELWKGRVPTSKSDQVVFLTGARDWDMYQGQNRGVPSRSTRFFVDYQLSAEGISGLEWIDHAGVPAEKCTLVSSYADDSRVQGLCMKKGMKIIPKWYLPHIPILWESS